MNKTLYRKHVRQHGCGAKRNCNMQHLLKITLAMSWTPVRVWAIEMPMSSRVSWRHTRHMQLVDHLCCVLGCCCAAYAFCQSLSWRKHDSRMRTPLAQFQLEVVDPVRHLQCKSYGPIMYLSPTQRCGWHKCSWSLQTGQWQLDSTKPQSNKFSDKIVQGMEHACDILWSNWLQSTQTTLELLTVQIHCCFLCSSCGCDFSVWGTALVLLNAIGSRAIALIAKPALNIAYSECIPNICNAG